LLKIILKGEKSKLEGIIGLGGEEGGSKPKKSPS